MAAKILLLQLQIFRYCNRDQSITGQEIICKKWKNRKIEYKLNNYFCTSFSKSNLETFHLPVTTSHKVCKETKISAVAQILNMKLFLFNKTFWLLLIILYRSGFDQSITGQQIILTLRDIGGWGGGEGCQIMGFVLFQQVKVMHYLKFYYG